jgi:hypothetical protein
MFVITTALILGIIIVCQYWMFYLIHNRLKKIEETLLRVSQCLEKEKHNDNAINR